MTRAIQIAKPRPWMQWVGHSPLITVIKRKKIIFLSRGCVRRLPGIILLS